MGAGGLVTNNNNGGFDSLFDEAVKLVVASTRVDFTYSTKIESWLF